VTEVTEVDSEGLCSWTSGDLWVVSLLLSLSELLNGSSPLAWFRLRLSVSSKSPRSDLASEGGDSVCFACC
jgi:hypothetical protein